MDRRPDGPHPSTVTRLLGGMRSPVAWMLMLVLVLVLGACGRVSPDPTSPEPTGGNGRHGGASPAPAIENTIAYVKRTSDGDQIRLINPDGTADRLLWPTGGTDPEIAHEVTSIAWRPDNRAIAFTSSHELSCSWYHADVYLLRSDGDGLRRVTNAPACADLAGLPTGRVTVGVQNLSFSSGLFQVYVQGATGLEQISLGPGAGGTVTFDAVADLGAGLQPAVVILGGYRWIGGAAVDVQPGATVHAGDIVIGGEGVWHMGADKVVWHADGERLGYVFGECARLYGVAAAAESGAVGAELLGEARDGVNSCAMAWGPTEATKEDILHLVMGFGDDRGIYRTTEGAGVGTRLVEVAESGYGEFIDHVAWSSDGSAVIFSGFLFPQPDPFDYDYAGNLYRHDFTSDTITRVTSFTSEFVRAFNLAPDGEHAVLEVEAELGSDRTDLYVVRLDGTGLRLLATEASRPAWSR
jgi:hypothetical protein